MSELEENVKLQARVVRKVAHITDPVLRERAKRALGRAVLQLGSRNEVNRMLNGMTAKNFALIFEACVEETRTEIAGPEVKNRIVRPRFFPVRRMGMPRAWASPARLVAALSWPSLPGESIKRFLPRRIRVLLLLIQSIIQRKF